MVFCETTYVHILYKIILDAMPNRKRKYQVDPLNLNSTSLKMLKHTHFAMHFILSYFGISIVFNTKVPSCDIRHVPISTSQKTDYNSYTAC